MGINLTNDCISIYNCKIEDISRTLKAMELLNKTVKEIRVKANFDFDTKYYHKYEESFINKLHNECYNNSIIVTVKNNRLYKDDLILPQVETLETVYIYIE